MRCFDSGVLAVRAAHHQTHRHRAPVLPVYLRGCSGRFHLQSTVYIKEADLLMRAGNDGEHQTALVETLRALTRTALRGTSDAAGEKKEVSIWK